MNANPTTAIPTLPADPAAPADQRKQAKNQSKQRKAAARRIAHRIASNDGTIKLVAAVTADTTKRAKQESRDTLAKGRKLAFSDMLDKILPIIEASLQCVPGLIEDMQADAADAVKQWESLSKAAEALPAKTAKQREERALAMHNATADIDAMIAGKGKHAAYRAFLAVGVDGRVSQYVPNAAGRAAWLDDVNMLDADDIRDHIAEHVADIKVAGSGGDRMPKGRTTTADVAAAGMGLYASKAEQREDILREWCTA